MVSPWLPLASGYTELPFLDNDQKVLDLVQWYTLAPSCQRLHRITVFDNDQKVLDLV